MEVIRVSLFHSNGVDITKARIIINEKHNQKKLEKEYRKSSGVWALFSLEAALKIRECGFKVHEEIVTIARNEKYQEP